MEKVEIHGGDIKLEFRERELCFDMEEEDLIFPSTTSTSTTMLSTRELGAKLWEILPQPRVSNISSKNKNIDTVSSSVLPYSPNQTAAALNHHRASPSASSIQRSTEFHNILNRIWNMEEQHASNLKTELDQSRARIKDLTRIVKKGESVPMDGKKFRKLAQEVSEVRITLSNALKNLNKEKEDRILLEDICDEFAKGIRDYENELQSIKHKIGNNNQVHCHDTLILHLSEAWIDERMQMKKKQQVMESEKITIVDKLKFEIETFLQAKHDLKCRHSYANASSSSVKEWTMKSSLREKLLEARLEEGMHSLKNI